MNIKKIATLSTLVFGLALSGCGKEDKKAEVKPETSGDSYPIVIKHKFGETTIKAKPKKIATISWGNQDVPLALGIAPVGVSKANYGVSGSTTLLPWTKAKFKELGVENPVTFNDVDGLDYEGMKKVSPDVILAGYSGITKEEYDLLSKIAPVVPYKGEPWQTSWRDQIKIDSTGMGMKQEGEEMVKKLENLITEKIQKYPKLKGKTAAFAYFSPKDLGKFYIYLPGDPRAAYLTDLGLKFPDKIKELAKDSTSFSVLLSAENVDVLKGVDILVAYGNEELLKAMQKDKLLKTVPVIANSAVALFEDNSPLAASATPSALSLPANIDEYLKILGSAADNVK